MEGIDCDIDRLNVGNCLYSVLCVCAYGTSVDYFVDCVHRSCSCRICLIECQGGGQDLGCCSYRDSGYILEDILCIYKKIGAYGQIAETLNNLADTEYFMVSRYELHAEGIMKHLEPYLEYTTEEIRHKLNNPKQDQPVYVNTPDYGEIDYDAYMIMKSAFNMVNTELI